MKIFVSWSGKLSKEVGSLLKKYLPVILHDVDVFMSAHDIAAGSRWSDKLAFELEQSNYGLVCFSPGNLDAKWLLFEAGAISKLGDSGVCGLLLSGLKPTDISGPLSQFQNRRFVEGDFYQLVEDINKRLEQPKNDQDLRLLFDAFWPKIESEYQALLARNESGRAPHRERTEIELLEELLFRVRLLESRPSDKLAVSDLNLEGVLQLPVTPSTVSAYSRLKFPDLEISESWQDQMLVDINSNRYQFIRDLDAALGRALPAVEACRRENPALFRYSTDYLTKALGFVDLEYRETHPWGLSTVEAFAKFAELVKK